MKNLISIFAFITISVYANPIQLIKNVKKYRSITREVDIYRFTDQGHSQIPIGLHFGKSELTNLSVLKQLKKETILSIDLVYTDFPKNDLMDSLNLLRMQALYAQWPELFNNKLIEWNFVKQTGIKNRKQAEKAFHGFVFNIRAYKGYDYEMDAINEMLNLGKPADSTLLKVFERNKNWKDMYIITDVTASMFPYTAELLFWFKLALKKNLTKAFVFFNDDEDNSTTQENTFDNLGMWETTSENFEKILRLCSRAMNKGRHFENNLEAIFYTLKKYPEAQNLVMIADNWEDPCDMNLLSELKAIGKPVHIIVCGVNKVINTNYLDIAYATGGTVHTLEEDMSELIKLNEGEKLKIGSERYVIKNGKFEHLEVKTKVL